MKAAQSLQDPGAEIVENRMQLNSTRAAAPSVARWTLGLLLAVVAMTALFGGLALARGDRPSCALLAAGLDLRSLLGAERTASPAEDAASCRDNPHVAVRTVGLTASEQATPRQ